MTAQSGLGFSGIVAIQIPAGGAVGEVLTKQTADNYDYDWAAGGGGGGGVVTALSLQTGGTMRLTQDAGTSPIDLDMTPEYLVWPGLTGGQMLYGGDSGGGDLTIQGRNDAALGLVLLNSPVIFGPYEPSGEAYGFSYTATETFTSNFIGGGLNFSGTIDFTAGTFIYESFRGAPSITSNVNPGFAAYTVLQALPILIAGPGAGNNPLAPLILNAGAQIRQPFAGTRTVSSVQAVNFASTLNPTVNGATINCTNWVGMTVLPSWNTVAGSICNFGTVRGVWARNPAQALFGQSLGIERLNAYYGLDVENITLNSQFGTAPRAAVRSAMTAGNNKWFLQNIGTAPSDFGVSSIRFSDNSGVQLGTGQDVTLTWDGTQAVMSPAIGEDLYQQFSVQSTRPTYIIEAENFGASETAYTEVRFGFDRFAIGSVGSVGNQVVNFTVPNRTAAIGGGWADYLMTQAGNLNLGVLAMSDVSSWVINAISFDNTAYSISELATLRIGGMTVSNPGGTVTERAALWSTGRFHQRGSVQYPPIDPAALVAGNNNDWAGLLTGSPNNNTRFWARISGNASGSDLTGIDSTAVQDGDTFELSNVSANIIRLMHEDTNSLAANRIVNQRGENFVLQVDATVRVRYDSTTARWRVVTTAGAVAPIEAEYRFDNSTTMADPGSGDFRNNNATLASVTAIAISDISFRGGDVSNILSSLAAGDQMYIQNRADGTEFMTFNITSTVDNTTWWQINGTTGDSGAAFTNNAGFGILFIFA